VAHSAPISRVTARAFKIPTDAQEADGTLTWNSATVVVVDVEAAGKTGTGYSYTHAAAADIVTSVLAGVLRDEDAFSIPCLWQAMVGSVRNIGRPGLGASAISAADIALWDLKAKLLEVPLVLLLGQARDEVPIYGSGGFTSYSVERLREQLAGWVEGLGCRWVKMKVGSAPEHDLERVRAAREAIGTAGLYVDANGAYTRKQALHFAGVYSGLGVVWFEEPVSSDDLDGLHLMRDRAPAPMEIAAGEYGYDQIYFRRMLQAEAVDVLQADATRCGGYSGFLKAAALADAWGIPLSAHTAPALHLPVCCAAPRLRNIEWFHDHVRIERRLFDGAPEARAGAIRPDISRPGHGLRLKEQDAERLAA
jgi:L-alanine-DL-glutamate epimerase-like enolase superfamily enzyme